MVAWSQVPMKSFQASPKFMAPRHSGETLREAFGESRRYRLRGPLGGGAMGRAIVAVFTRITRWLWGGSEVWQGR